MSRPHSRCSLYTIQMSGNAADTPSAEMFNASFWYETFSNTQTIRHPPHWQLLQLLLLHYISCCCGYNMLLLQLSVSLRRAYFSQFRVEKSASTRSDCGRTVTSASSLQRFCDPLFSVARPTVWHSLPDHLHDPADDSEQFRRDLKTYLLTGHSKC